MTIFWQFEKSSPRVVATGESDQLAGARGAVTKYNSGAEIVRMPSGSIAQIPAFESPDLPQSGFNKPLLFALAVNFICWGFILLAGRAIAHVFL